jgi:hypothetical protein
MGDHAPVPVSEPGVAPEVRQFLAEHVETYEELEVLLLLARKRDRAWNPESVGVELRISTLVAVKTLDDLCRGGLADALKAPKGLSYTYRPRSSRLDQLVAGLVQAYERNPIDVIRVMNESALGRVRAAAARTFADAFVIPGKKKGDG